MRFEIKKYVFLIHFIFCLVSFISCNDESTDVSANSEDRNAENFFDTSKKIPDLPIPGTPPSVVRLDSAKAHPVQNNATDQQVDRSKPSSEKNTPENLKNGPSLPRRAANALKRPGVQNALSVFAGFIAGGAAAHIFTSSSVLPMAAAKPEPSSRQPLPESGNTAVEPPMPVSPGTASGGLDCPSLRVCVSACGPWEWI